MFQPEMKDFYQREGYLAVEGVLSEQELSQIRKHIDALIANPESPPEGVGIGREGNTVANKDSDAAKNDDIRGASFLVRFIPFFQDIARTPKLLSLARGLLGPRVKVFRDQALFKPPGGQAKPPHQDQSYFRVQPGDDLVTAWIALDDSTLENGCMCYVSGSHKHGIFPVEPDPDRPVHHIPNTGDLELPPPTAVPVPAGSVVFHHGCTLHHSEENKSDTWRKAIIFHYSTSEARSEKEELNEQVSLEID
jgi:ectoine hydroxylase-related dioxygenase (phytanoyl-CoA dioxygenase family)